jgi:hypothetical protein
MNISEIGIFEYFKEKMIYMQSTMILNILYWIIFAGFSFSLFVAMYALSAFFALLIVVIQLSEISTYLANVLLQLKDKQENSESKK